MEDTSIRQVAPSCVCTLLRKASRALARVYEAELAKAGLTATQFAILRELEREGAMLLMRLSEALVMERTSLYRALRPLVRAGWIALHDTCDARAKEACLTPAGFDKIQDVLPYWQRAQSDFLAAFGAQEWQAVADGLGRTISISQRT
jgi:DNA-binding MarR family transcriptional regulator